MAEFKEEIYLRQKALALCNGLFFRLEEFVDEFPAGEPAALITKIKLFLTQVKVDLNATSDCRLLRLSCFLIYELSSTLELLDNAHTAQTPRGIVQLLNDTSALLFGRKASVLVSPSTEYNYSISNIVPPLRQLAETSLSASARKTVLDQLVDPFYVVRFPRIERDNVLIHAIFGHEFGHPIADEFIAKHETEASYQTRFQQAQQKVQAHPDVAARLNAHTDPMERKKLANRIFDDLAKIHRRGLQELVSDAFAVYLFGPSAAFAAVDVLLQSSLDDPPVPSQFYPPTRYRWRLMHKIMEERGLVAGLEALKFPVGLEHVQQSMVAALEYMKKAVGTDSDKQAIARYPVVSVAYEWLDTTLADALKYAFDRAGNLGFSAALLAKHLPELIERLWLKVPPCETGVWPAVNSIDWRLPLLAGWLMSLCYASDNSMEQDEQQTTLHTNQRLALKGVEFALLRKDFRTHTEQKTAK